MNVILFIRTFVGSSPFLREVLRVIPMTYPSALTPLSVLPDLVKLHPSLDEMRVVFSSA